MTSDWQPRIGETVWATPSKQYEGRALVVRVFKNGKFAVLMEGTQITVTKADMQSLTHTP